MLQSSGQSEAPIRLHEESISPSLLARLGQLVDSGSLASDNATRAKLSDWFSGEFGSAAVYLTPSCTDALEMSGLLSQLAPSDEVIVPAYTFATTASAYLWRTEALRFADSLAERPCVDLATIAPLVTKRTKVVVVMHYAGLAVDLDPILAFCREQGLLLVEDAAHAMGSRYRGRPLGTMGDFGTLSFHHTKALSCGEGGCLLVRDAAWKDRADIIYEKGTNRRFFYQGEVPRYEWMELGSSYVMSSLQSAALSAQLEVWPQALERRKALWQQYEQLLAPGAANGWFALPSVPQWAEVNGSHYYLVADNEVSRDRLIRHLAVHGIESAFHYGALHRSRLWASRSPSPSLPNTERFASSLLRIPLHTRLTDDQQHRIAETVLKFYKAS
ncbi:MAG: dTDP-4-amino-4,6-dideoxygalactose transaminase [Saprospiraceae bacterium]|jgi:dTDP-4-amino-4,6-dideoxygalactose transaminase|nr:dTDP-4-amino-4,6-dideoxygalactose transaminase [Saprospiraceae bacterium]